MVKYLHIGVKGVRKCNFYTYFRHCIYSFKERGWEVQKPHCSHVIYEWYLIAIWRGPQPKGRSVFPSFLSDPRIKDAAGDFILQVNFFKKIHILIPRKFYTKMHPTYFLEWFPPLNSF